MLTTGAARHIPSKPPCGPPAVTVYGLHVSSRRPGVAFGPQPQTYFSGVVPSISLMFGYNAGGGAYLPRQGSFMIQCADTLIGLTGPSVVKSALGETVTADELSNGITVTDPKYTSL